MNLESISPKFATISYVLILPWLFSLGSLFAETPAPTESPNPSSLSPDKKWEYSGGAADEKPAPTESPFNESSSAAGNAQEKPEIVCTSPKGTFKIESEPKSPPPGIEGIDVADFVVSATDPKVREPLDDHPDTTHVSYIISPDEKWIYESMYYGSRMTGGQLFKRANGPKFKSVNGDFNASVWQFFAKEEKIEAPRVPYFAGESREGIIDFVAWSPDSCRVLLSLRVGDFDGVRQRGVHLWYLYFNTKDGNFELTDRLRAANKGAWKRRENFGDPEAKFKELTTAEPVD